MLEEWESGLQGNLGLFFWWKGGMEKKGGGKPVVQFRDRRVMRICD